MSADKNEHLTEVSLIPVVSQPAWNMIYPTNEVTKDW